MSEPVFSETTEDMWSRLPAIYREEDAKRDWPMKRYMAVTGDMMGDIEALIDRISYTSPENGGEPGDTSDLVDSRTADESWLSWIAMVRGIKTPPGSSIEQRRTYLASNRYNAGTKASMVEVIQAILGGTKYVRIYDHSNLVDGIGNGSEWEVLIVTKSSESDADIVDLVIRSELKPAGVLLYHLDADVANWNKFESEYPTWDAMQGKTWGQIETADGIPE